MFHHIQVLEKLNNKQRVEYLKETLRNTDVSFGCQLFRQRILKGENIIVDEFSTKESKNQLLFTAHTNKYFSSPGANDNASGVSVLLGIIRELKDRSVSKNANIKLIFLDHEDGLAYLDGSTYYVNHTDTSRISFVLNLDGVGIGNTATLCPKVTEKVSNRYIRHLLDILKKSNIRHFSFNMPPLLIEDHIPFARAGVTAISLNLMPESDLDYLISRSRASSLSLLKEMLLMRFNQRNHPMFVMQHRHNELDTSEYIREESLELAKRIAMQIIKYHSKING